MPVLPLHPNSAAAVFVPQRSRAHVEASGDALRKALGIVGCFNPNHVTTDLVLEFERSTESYELSLIENCKPIATFGFFHQMGCDNHRDLLVITQTVKILPNIAPCARIEDRPPLGIISVERTRKSVVLPLPFGPSNPNSSAGRTSNETPFNAIRSS